VIAAYRAAVAGAEAATPPVPGVTLEALEVSGRAPLEIEVAFKSDRRFELELSIIDASRRVLFSTRLPASGDRLRVRVDHAGLSPGRYSVLARACVEPPVELHHELVLAASA
jgi:hypothetical protein